MSAPNKNTLWARALVDELARSGVRHVAMAPGSRSTPLVLAAARYDAITVHVHLDERSAAFHALGAGKATGTPAAVVTTSGTAAANLHPAVIEATQSQRPLLLLTADRPHRLRGADANQAIDQVKLFGTDVRAFHDVPPPSTDPNDLRHLRQIACRAVADAQGPPAGPVHLNLPFAKPLEPTPVEGEIPEGFADEHALAARGRPDGAPFVRATSARSTLASDELDQLAVRVAEAERGLIVAGPHPDPARVGPAAIALAQATGFPVLADPLSGARFTPGATEHAIAHYDLHLAAAGRQRALAPDLVLRVGTTPTSQHAAGYLAHHEDVDQILVDEGPRYTDHLAVAKDHVRADAAVTLRALADRLSPSGDQAWRATWREHDETTQRVLDQELDADPFEGTVLAHAARSVPADGQLVVGNSMPIRDLDAYAGPRDEQIHVVGNRGASGIDGLVSTAIGAASATQRPTVAVLGDLSFLHDLNGLHALPATEAPLVLVVVDNDGGGIFHKLPIREHEGFTDYFATPHGRDLAHAVSLHELDHDRLDDPGTLAEALAHALEDPHGQVIEVRSDRAANHRRQQAVAKRVLAGLEETPER